LFKKVLLQPDISVKFAEVKSRSNPSSVNCFIPTRLDTQPNLGGVYIQNFAAVQPKLLKILAKMATILESHTAKPAIKGKGKVIPLQARCGPEGG
jgi:hypothetical protein